ncbi:MAG TPA: helix-turn-helix transcriptional regulator [Streptosporangiaceae bacterium]|nr:helix-turn-helix transcriptional regulator [Streptosporangiaceae bacterium]
MDELAGGGAGWPGIQRDELAGFLRGRRSRLRPGDVGLPGGGRRRTPGLRRQEVAELAGMSVDYYIRLEQGRGPHPSDQILAALARALMLTRDERDYLFRIAGMSPPPAASPAGELAPATRHLLGSLDAVPAYVLDARYDVLAWNQLATYFIGDLSAIPAADRNILRWMFRQPGGDPRWSDTDTLAFARGSVADLRAAYARYPRDRRIGELVTELRGCSPRFAAMWAEQQVAVRRPVRKRLIHPEAGPLEFDCHVLPIPDTDQRLVIYSAEPGSATWAAFRELGQRARDQHASGQPARGQRARGQHARDQAFSPGRETAGAGRPAGPDCVPGARDRAQEGAADAGRGTG